MTQSNISFHEFLETEMKSTVKSTLVDLREAGRLAPITQHAEYKIDFISQWNKFVEAGYEGMETYEARFLAEDIWRSFVQVIFSAQYKHEREHPDVSRDDPEFIAFLREILSEGLEAGDVTQAFSGIKVHSPVVSDRIVMTLHAWQPRFQQYDQAANKYVSLNSIDVKPVTHVEVDLPTGELLISDWFRIPEFTEVANNQDFQINFGEDRIKRTLNGIRQLNLMEAAFHGSRPDITLGKDAAGEDNSLLRVGPLDRDEYSDEALNPDLEAQVVGNVSPEYWGVTMIDRADLISILTEALGSKEAAEGKLEELMNHTIPSYRPTVIKLDPGVWHYYFVEGNATADVTCLEQATDALGKGMKTTVMLSRTPVEFREDLVRDEVLSEAAPALK